MVSLPERREALRAIFPENPADLPVTLRQTFEYWVQAGGQERRNAIAELGDRYVPPDGSNCREEKSRDLLLARAEIEDCLIKVENIGYTLLPGNDQLTSAEIGLLRVEQREYRLREALQAIKHQFDFIFIDSPPSLNMLTVNGLVAADSVIIPTQCEYYALEGLSALLATIERIRQTANPNLQIEGVLRTMFDPRNNLANDVSSQLTAHFGDSVYRTIIPRNVTLAEAPSHGLPVINYDKNSRGARAYLALAGEMLRRSEAASTHSHSVDTQ